MDAHYRINLLLSLSATLLSFLFLEGTTAWLVAFFNYSVLTVELLNTAIERAVDTATEEFSETAKLAKDAAAAAVLTVGLFAAAADLYFLIPAILRRLL